MCGQVGFKFPRRALRLQLLGRVNYIGDIAQVGFDVPALDTANLAQLFGFCFSSTCEFNQQVVAEYADGTITLREKVEYPVLFRKK